MQPNRVKKILKSGGIAMGTYVGGIADPQIVEIIGHAGFDAAFIDMEHTSFDLSTVQLMVMAAERVGVTPIVRPPGFDPAFLLRLLDMGVQGVQIPHITDANAAREAVKAVRYPPLGERGMAGASRASNFGALPLTEHMRQSNEEITLAVMIEDLPSLDQIEEIAQVEGIDIVAIGPSDMSRALGVAGSSDHPKMAAAVDRVRAALAKGKGARLALPTHHAAFPRNAKQLLELGVGYTNFAPSPEARLLKVLRDQISAERKAMG
ncbi:MAG: hypothetical protein FJY56_02935 [Betaproteobacteria bacterium]|nr:hypothetical protein [Betaproteobacteria bacterium]